MFTIRSVNFTSVILLDVGTLDKVPLPRIRKKRQRGMYDDDDDDDFKALCKGLK